MLTIEVKIRKEMLNLIEDSDMEIGVVVVGDESSPRLSTDQWLPINWGN